MQNITKIYEDYVKQEKLDPDWKQQVYEKLSTFKPADLKTIDEHRMFVEVLQKFRRYNSEDMKLNGKKFLDTIVSLLAVGEDGVYSSNLRFMYELIQNVDDCDYKDKENCHLDILFDTESLPGKIVLTYNENGFSPFNVFSITGIAEESKNVSADRVEIGEKGIGFKSVFGVAEKVHIESGMFSFELNKENFTVPIPKYDKYTPVDGTRLTIYLDSEHSAKGIHKELIEQYGMQNAVLNKNPILFLNKLTHLKIRDSADQYVEFDVAKSDLQLGNNAVFEERVNVSVGMRFLQFGRPQVVDKEIICRRYTMPIAYGEEECKSRYGNDVGFTERKHKIVAMFPELDKNLKTFEGVMYSFLPTQIKLNAPLVLHVPYKLDGSREFVDPQGGNAWFSYTNEILGDFLKACYIHLAHEINEDIVAYLPKKYAPIFKQDNEKVKCLNLDIFKAQALYEEKVFYCVDGTFNNFKDIVSFDSNEDSKRETHIKIFEYLKEQAKLFIPKEPAIDMKWFGVKILSDVNRRLFLAGLRNEKIFEDVIEILESSEEEVHYYQLLASMEGLRITPSQVKVIAKNKKLSDGFTSIFKTRIDEGKLPAYELITNDKGDRDLSLEIKELVEATELSKKFERYLHEISYKVITVDVDTDEFAFPANNAVVLSKKGPLGSFSALSSDYDPRHTFSATLKIRQASNKLNDVDDDISNTEYLKLLRDVRLSLVQAFGKTAYNSYISIVNKAGADNNRFLGELLQNADDCEYDPKVIPEFSLAIHGNELTVEYNEKGFLKENVRAITAIGESTKKLLLSGEDKAIGEKGIGFKSVFGVAKSVEIHSNGFDFKLLGSKPTIPEKCAAIDVKGTRMLYDLKDNSVRNSFSQDMIVRHCLCLRKLKKIDINGTLIHITDEDNKRFITVDDKEYEFDKFVYDFDILDTEAIEERESNHKVISSNQYVAYYIPPKGLKLDTINLYTGLPVSQVECLIPLVIDAPFELTTSRDNVLQCKWNQYVKEALYEGILELIDQKKKDLGIDVLRFVRFQNVNGTGSFATFNNAYLNGFDWSDSLEDMEILPCLVDEEFIKPCRKARIVPDVIADAVLVDESDEPYEFYGTLIDTRHKSQYLPLLEFLGCEKCDLEEVLGFISENTDTFLANDKTRDALYKYLSSEGENFEDELLDDQVADLPIFPIRTESGTEYVAYEGKLYTHPTEKSSDDFNILDTEVMSFETCHKILGSDHRVNELTQEVYDARYIKNLVSIIQSYDKTNEEKAKFLLREFKLNRENFDKCRYSLIGLLPQIPLEMANGNFGTGNKYINEQGLILSGEMIQNLYVSEKYDELARYLGCTDITKIHYSDIDVEISEISDDEIQDIQDNFENYADILSGLINDRIITDEQIEKFNLQYLAYGINGDNHGEVYDEEDDEDFPGKPVANIDRLRKYLKVQFLNNPNPYVKKRRIVREALHRISKEKKNYTNSMYMSAYDERKCFCQMCKKKVYESYIERNDVQVKPKYAWKQMYLSLCLICSKDYGYLRANEKIWKDFVEKIIDTDIDEDDEVIEIPIAERTITFTATHLAEIQRILELESDDTRVFDEAEAIDAVDNDDEAKIGISGDGDLEDFDYDDDLENSSEENEEVSNFYKYFTDTDEDVSFDEDFVLIDQEHVYLTMLNMDIADSEEGDEYLIVKMALRNGLNSSLRLKAKMIAVNGIDVCDESLIFISNVDKLKQIVFFVIPFDEIPDIDELDDIEGVAFYVEADYVLKGNEGHLESEIVESDTDGYRINDEESDED